MKIALAQVQSKPGDISGNIAMHASYIKKAAELGADLVAFPELSLTNYEPTLANQLAVFPDDNSMRIFDTLSNDYQISILAGMPVKKTDGICIAAMIFSPGMPRQVYCKQILHADEKPFFVPGNKQLIFSINKEIIAPAICYESVQPEHAARAFSMGAEIYLASVSKPARALQNAYAHYTDIARVYQKPVLLVNGIGPADNFKAGGKSGYWSQEGKLLAALDETTQGILLADLAEETGLAFDVNTHL
jgi:predicted amidohydrolase